VAWYHFGFKRVIPEQATGSALTAAGAALESRAALTAAAVAAEAPLAQFMRHTDRWQNEAWGYYDTLGEFNYAVTWLSNMLSRVRLRAAEVNLDTDEPSLLSTGLPAEIMGMMGMGPGGKAELMKRLAIHLAIPGECYLIGEETGGVEQWMVRSVDEVRASGNKYQVTNENNPNLGNKWRDLAPNALPVRVWQPHARFYHLADSPARSALTIMHELELVNRHIAAQYLSRLASAGVLVIPDEISFPVREEFADAEDPFMMEWIEIAATAIKKPGSASSVVPIPLRVPAEYVKDIQHLDFTLALDDKILDKRDQVIRRLATKLDIPSDVMLGLADTNHWSAWAAEEQGLKVHIAPYAETICHALTTGYLAPRLKASDEAAEPGQFVAWYDMSELTQRPDRSQNALNAYDRFELSGTALRREIGFDEDDAPTDEELKDILLKSTIRLHGGSAPGAIDVLLGEDLMVPATVGPGAVAGQNVPVGEPGEPQPDVPAPPAPQAAPSSGPPQAGGDHPADKAAAAVERAARLAAVSAAAIEERRRAQATTQHAVKLNSPDGRWDLRHPPVCAEHSMSCPFTHAVVKGAPVARPGMPGTYLCRLDAFGRLVIDGPAPYLDTGSMTSTLLTPSAATRNGHAHV
jgi:hypothetical protein